MIANGTFKSGLNLWRLMGWNLVAGLLLAPAVAMRFTDEVAWTASDFAFAALLLVGGGLLIELALWKAKNARARLAVCMAVLVMVGLIWAEGAVGLLP